MEFLDLFDDGSSVKARLYIRHPVLGVEQDTRRDIDQVTPVDHHRQRVIACWKQPVELARNTVAEIEEMAAVDDDAIALFITHALSDTRISPVSFLKRQRTPVFLITSHDKPPYWLMGDWSGGALGSPLFRHSIPPLLHSSYRYGPKTPTDDCRNLRSTILLTSTLVLINPL